MSPAFPLRPSLSFPALALASLVLAGRAGAETVLLSDTFTGNYVEIASYDLSGQTGSLAPITYSTTAYGWQSNLIGEALVLNCAGLFTPSASPNHDFASVGHLRIEADITKPAGYGWIKFGGGLNQDFRTAGGGAIAFNWLDNTAAGAAITLYDGTAPAASFSNVINGSGPIQIDLVGLQSGDTSVAFWFNGTQFDLNGAAAGKEYVIAGSLAQNYLTFGHMGDGSNSPYTWTIDNLKVSSVPEPATYGLALGGLALVAAAAVRRRKISK